MFAVLCTQHRCERVSGNASWRAFQKPIAPSPMASSGPRFKPLHFKSRSISRQLSSLSRYPSVIDSSSLFPSSSAAMITRMQDRSSSRRTLKYIPSAQKYTYAFLERSLLCHCWYSSSHLAFRRTMFVADNPFTESPRIASRARGKSPVEIPLRYRAGIRLSILGILRKYLGRIFDVNGSSPLLFLSLLSSTRGCLIAVSYTHLTLPTIYSV